MTSTSVQRQRFEATRYDDLTPEEQATIRMAQRMGLVEYKSPGGNWTKKENDTQLWDSTVYRIRPCPNQS
jgi:hypothetical protein